ncbi:MAG: molybdopterin molybdotransferase [Solirubrobacteraceae bacterium]|jgi:molybdopterin molybdotransferase|nr:molybdopterin molybdotransferase [Solirubrobacteraceae bacterium]
MTSIEEALELVLDGLRALERETVPIAGAHGRVAADPVRSAVDLPPFDRSAMDGYALRAADTATGRALRLAGGVAAGEVATAALEPGTAVRISTGAEIPPGADAVLQSERASERDGTVTPDGALAPGTHVRARGEDVHAGDVLAAAGARLTLPRVSALASAGVGIVPVVRRPRVGVLVTGSELLALGAPPEPGRIHESNGLMIGLLAAQAGAESSAPATVLDDREATIAAVGGALDGADVLVVSGGVSVGPHDHVRPAFEACGVEEVFWRVQIRPGKPIWFGRRGERLVFGLPGNPLSTIVCFCMFIAPALRRLGGEAAALPLLERGRLAVPAAASDGRTTFLTARIAAAEDGVLEATPTGRQGSHMTGALGESDGFAVVPDSAGSLPAGAPVALLPLA